MGEIAVFSVVYSGVEPYIPEFLSSLSKQTDKDFTLFLINDGLVDIDIFLKKVDLDVKIIKKSGLPAELRKFGIEWIVSEGAKKIIFADADDYFANNRIEMSKKISDDYDLICNELLLVGQDFPKPIPMLGKFFENKTEINKDHIAAGNCMGLTNTTLCTESIPSCFGLIPDSVIAFDWALFAMCIHAGARTVFTNETKTYYRQHINNTASVQSFSEKQIMRGVQVKKDHYQLLSKFYEDYTRLANLFENLFFQLQNDKILKEKYCQAVKQQAPDVSLWWEPIKLFEELGLYEVG